MIDDQNISMELSATNHRFYAPWKVASQLLQGKSLTRALFNLSLCGESISGSVLDLGSKQGGGSYYQYLRMSPGTKRVFTDLTPGPGISKLDVEAPFPFPDESFDAILAFHIFEHVYHYRAAPHEMFRVLRPGGKALVAIPFLYRYHADPQDYYRLTDVAQHRMWTEAGFRSVQIEALGEGLVTQCATALAELLTPHFLRAPLVTLSYLLTTPLDRLISLRPPLYGKRVSELYALEHLAVLEKR